MSSLPQILPYPGTDIVKAVRDLNAHIIQSRCLAHSLNNGITKALEQSSTHPEEPATVNPTVRSIRTLVNWARGSNNMLLLLKEVQEESGRKAQKPLPDGGIRWYSTVDMLQRYLDMHTDFKEAIDLGFTRKTIGRSDLDWIYRMVNDTIDIDEVKELTEVLNTLKFYGRILEKEEPGSLSTALLSLYHLVNYHLATGTNDRQSIQEFKKCCQRYLVSTVNPQRVAIAAGSCYVDPRFAHPEKAWNNEIPNETLAEAKSWIKRSQQVVEEIIKRYWRNQAEKRKLPDSLSHLKFDATSEVAAFDSSEDEVCTFEHELRAERRKFKTIAKSSDESPLVFWRKHCDTLPLLAGAARVFLALPASSAPAERVFSIAGQFNTRKANRTAGETLRDILVIKNCWHGWLDLGRRVPEAPFAEPERGFLSTVVEEELEDQVDETVNVPSSE